MHTYEERTLLMNTTEIFEILGIEATKDLDAITAAYHEELRKHHPEEDPEGFQKVRQAFEAARDYANREDDEPQGFVGDVNLAGPINDYLITLGDAYASFPQRIDPKKWEELLQNPVLEDFEYGAQAKKETMRFLMDHYWLPISVYKVIDQRFLIKEQQKELLEYLPQDFMEFLLDKLIEGKLDFPYDQVSGYPEKDTENKIDHFIQGVIYAISPNNEKVLPETVKEIKDTGLDHPWMLLIESLEEKEEGKKAWFSLPKEKQDEILIYCDALVEGEYKKATIAYRAWELKAVDAMAKSAWRDAFFFYRNMLYIYGSPIAMKGSIDSGNELIDLFIQKDELDERACEVFLVACDMCDQTKKGLEYFKQHEDQKKKTAAFFALYSVLLRKDGRFIEALKYIERAQEIGDDSFDFKKLKLAVFKDQQNYEKMESFAEAILEENDRDYGAILDLQEAYEAKGNDKGVVDLFYRARELYQYDPEIYIRAAKAFMRHENYADATRVLEDGVKAGAQSDEMEYNRVFAKAHWAAHDGYYQDGIDLLQTLVVKHPELYMKMARWYRDMYNDGMNYTLKYLEESHKCLDQYEKRLGADEDYYRMRAFLYSNEGNLEKCVAACEEGLRYMKTKKGVQRAYQRRVIYNFYMTEAHAYRRSILVNGQVELGNFKKTDQIFNKLYHIIITEKFFDESAQLAKEWGELFLSHGKYASGIYRMKNILNSEQTYNKTQNKSGEKVAHEMMGKLLIAQGLKGLGRREVNRTYLGGSVLATPKGKYDLAEYLSQFQRGYEYLIQMPDVFKPEEKGDFLTFQKNLIMQWKAQGGTEKTPAMLDAILYAAYYFPCVSTDLMWLVELLRSEEVIALFDEIASETGYYKYWEYLLRILVFMRSKEAMSDIAEDFKKAAEAQQGYCVKKQVPLEESITVDRFTSRLEAFDLAFYYACKGKLDKAKEYAAMTCSGRVCQFCTHQGCEDYFNIMAFIAFIEGNEDDVVRWCQVANQHVWHHHEILSTALLVQARKHV